MKGSAYPAGQSPTERPSNRVDLSRPDALSFRKLLAVSLSHSLKKAEVTSAEGPLIQTPTMGHGTTSMMGESNVSGLHSSLHAHVQLRCHKPNSLILGEFSDVAAGLMALNGHLKAPKSRDICHPGRSTESSDEAFQTAPVAFPGPVKRLRPSCSNWAQGQKDAAA